MNGQQMMEKVNAGGVIYGTMLAFARNPRWATPVGEFGLDYVILDTEHTPRGRADLADFLASLAGIDIVTIVRVPIPDSHYVTMALDAGAQGVLVPYCETVEEVTSVVAAARWRPLKGAAVSKVMDTGEFPSEATRKYLEEKNRNIVCIIGIESVAAVENLSNILQVNGLDAIFVGPNDLTLSLGVPDQYDHPDYEAALRKIIRLSREAGKPVLIHHQTVALSQKWLGEGARFVLYSSDGRSLHNAYRRDFGAIKTTGAEIEGVAAEEIGESKEVI